MPSIVYVQPDGSRQTITADVGSTVMATAMAHGVPGIVAECGGSAMCATCHVYVDEGSLAGLPPVSEVEDAMLASAASERRDNSRLSCQLVLAPGMETLVVNIPERQV
ncbi:2Fe-2S iron-sulfur cluster-binding protein [Hydrogenophaga crocea]|uniref:(2Fe-2S)-binding protein n=1 Tax=Hydrogenophaga crocea TaxID=2716225 RepID=A0A6G8IJS0_9BURK|nr:2Fe-2S iron-sulfur cluster-binding protein [Hydrogenophaga crocea]QIM53457.1 (2Fe-2S)-binding protein [Hydrogenophaga crocea]